MKFASLAHALVVLVPLALCASRPAHAEDAPAAQAAARWAAAKHAEYVEKLPRKALELWCDIARDFPTTAEGREAALRIERDGPGLGLDPDVRFAAVLNLLQHHSKAIGDELAAKLRRSLLDEVATSMEGPASQQGSQPAELSPLEERFRELLSTLSVAHWYTRRDGVVPQAAQELELDAALRAMGKPAIAVAERFAADDLAEHAWGGAVVLSRLQGARSAAPGIVRSLRLTRGKLRLEYARAVADWEGREIKQIDGEPSASVVALALQDPKLRDVAEVLIRSLLTHGDQACVARVAKLAPASTHDLWISALEAQWLSVPLPHQWYRALPVLEALGAKFPHWARYLSQLDERPHPFNADNIKLEPEHARRAVGGLLAAAWPATRSAGIHMKQVLAFLVSGSGGDPAWHTKQAARLWQMIDRPDHAVWRPELLAMATAWFEDTSGPFAPVPASHFAGAACDGEELTLLRAIWANECETLARDLLARSSYWRSALATIVAAPVSERVARMDLCFQDPPRCEIAPETARVALELVMQAPFDGDPGRSLQLARIGAAAKDPQIFEVLLHIHAGSDWRHWNPSRFFHAVAADTEGLMGFLGTVLGATSRQASFLCSTLRTLASTNPEAAELLRKASRGGPSQAAAIATLQPTDPHDRQVLQHLYRSYGTPPADLPSPAVVKCLVAAARRTHIPEALPFLLRCYETAPDSDVGDALQTMAEREKQLAVLRAGSSGSRQMEGELIRLLLDPELAVREAAVRTLGELGGVDASGALLRLAAEAKEDVDLRTLALASIQRIAERARGGVEAPTQGAATANEAESAAPK